MASVNTNYGASIALQNLNKTNSELERTQNRINTGMKVSSAKDNGAIWATAQNQKANMQVLNTTRNTLQRTQSVNDVGLAAGDTIMDALRRAGFADVGCSVSLGIFREYTGVRPT